MKFKFKIVKADSLPETISADSGSAESASAVSVTTEHTSDARTSEGSVTTDYASFDDASEDHASVDSESEESESTDADSGKWVSGRTNRGANMLKFFLMPFVCFISFGFQGPHGYYVMRLSLFAPIAFYILCGFMLAAKEEKHPEIYKRLMKRSAGQFALIFAILVVMNGVALWVTGSLGQAVSLIFTKKVFFEIIVLCIWPFQVGETIWFIQSLFYARVILYFMHKRGLMRHYKKVLIIIALLTVLFGEFAGIIHFNFLGYTYIPANAITRAIPYMLLGRLIYEKRDAFFSRPSWNYCLLFFVGIFAAIAEMNILSKIGRLVYSGHMLGYGVMAFSACCLFLKMRDVRRNFFVKHGKNYSWRIYLLSQPVGHLLLLVGSSMVPALYMMMRISGGIIVYLICLAIAYIFGSVRHQMRKEKRLYEQ